MIKEFGHPDCLNLPSLEFLKVLQIQQGGYIKEECAEGLSSPEGKMLMATYRMTSISKRHCSWEQWG